jgi:2,4-dienoyl-CoA reductase-like NADH-dependent reductase (Old Yellow Enzyme family)
MTPTIASPLDLPCGARLSNRLCKAAMTEGLADEYNRATEAHVRLYRRWSHGGAGLLLTGNIQVDRWHLERPGNVAIDDNGGFEQLKAFARAGTEAGNHLWAQVSHGGRQTPLSVNPAPLAPSAVALEMLDLPGFATARPRARTEAEVLNVIDRFAHAASVVRDAGFTGLQIHAAHGYLISQFLSPRVNRRTDAWGGSLENRARLLLEIVARVRRAVGADFPLSIKLNSSDFQVGGLTNAESAQVVTWLNTAGVDLLELSGGSWEQPRLIGLTVQEDQGVDQPKESTLRREAYFLETAARIRRIATMPIMVTGGFRSVAAMNQALADGELDVVGLARPLVAEPELARALIEGAAVGADDYIARLDPLHAMSWYYRQLIGLGAGDDVDLALDAAEASALHLASEERAAAALVGRRRA